MTREYRIDADKDVWLDSTLRTNSVWSQRANDYVNNKYCVNPSDRELRESILSLRGLSAAPRIVSITGGEKGFERPFEHREIWDGKQGLYNLSIRHNGPVDLKIDTTGIRRSPRPANLALGATVRASSCASLHTIPDNAIDSNDRSTRWEAAEKDQESWIQINLRAPAIVNRVVLKQYLDRVTDYRVECQEGDGWKELAAGKDLGPIRTVEFKPVTVQRVRLRVLGSKLDSWGISRAPALREFEVFGDEPGLAAPYAVEAVDGQSKRAFGGVSAPGGAVSVSEERVEGGLGSG